MDRLQRASVLLELADALQRRGSWCGETHMQKATYLLKEVEEVELPFEFVLYMYGPFSFDLGDELTSLRADGLLRLDVQRGYGAKLRPTESSVRLREHYPTTLARHRDAIEAVADIVRDRGVVELERLATALFVTLKAPGTPVAARAEDLKRIKPHIDVARGIEALREIDELRRARSGSGKAA